MLRTHLKKMLPTKFLRRWRNPHAWDKYRHLKTTAKKHNVKVFVETGTYLGDSVATLQRHFDAIYSIELSPELAIKAAQRFKKVPKVTIRHGNSAELLKEIIESLQAPALFWLDAHYSGQGTARGEVDSPVQEELEIVLSHWMAGSVLLIDDARLFNGTNGYPTLGQIRAMISRSGQPLQLTIDEDIIEIV